MQSPPATTKPIIEISESIDQEEAEDDEQVEISTEQSGKKKKKRRNNKKKKKPSITEITVPIDSIEFRSDGTEYTDSAEDVKNYAGMISALLSYYGETGATDNNNQIQTSLNPSNSTTKKPKTPLNKNSTTTIEPPANETITQIITEDTEVIINPLLLDNLPATEPLVAMTVQDTSNNDVKKSETNEIQVEEKKSEVIAASSLNAPLTCCQYKYSTVHPTIPIEHIDPEERDDTTTATDNNTTGAAKKEKDCCDLQANCVIS